MVEPNPTITHYTHGRLLDAIAGALHQAGKSPESATVQDLGPADEFHIGGRLATEHLAQGLALAGGQSVLDIGCGLGGTARFLASEYDVTVRGFDLTDEYVNAGNSLNQWVGLDQKIELVPGDALAMPFEPAAFERAVMLHVGMNIKNKQALFKQAFERLKPGGRFVLFDVMRLNGGNFDYPVPWAESAAISFIESPDDYVNKLRSAGFAVSSTDIRAEFAKAFFSKMKQAMSASDGPPPVGLQIVMGPQAPVKIGNLAAAVFAGTLAPVQIVADKPAV